MSINFLLERFQEFGAQEAVVWKQETYTYENLLEKIKFWRQQLEEQQVSKGEVLGLEGDFSPNALALFLTCIEKEIILVPLSPALTEEKKQEFLSIAQVQRLISLKDQKEVLWQQLDFDSSHEFYADLRKAERPGLVLFSSGSTGKSKASVHDITTLLEKFKVRRHTFRSISFLLFDHIGGINTMLYSLANGGCLVTVMERSPEIVLTAIEKYRVELLPTSPTFMNLILISEAWKEKDLSSLQTVTYGTEPMPASTLKRFHELFPKIKLLQTYGLSEVGILRSKSQAPDSLWVKIGGEGFQTKVEDGILFIKAKSAMLGYLNAPSPFTEDGWFNTGDSVEVQGEWFRILGRKSEIINVGGEKVYPAEVEGVILEFPDVAEVTVYGEKNAITGNVVCALIRPKSWPEDEKSFSRAIKKFCRGKIQKYKVPLKVSLTDQKQFSERMKKTRLTQEGEGHAPTKDLMA